MTPTNPQDGVERDRIARIIHPAPFLSWKSLYDYCLRQGDDEVTARRYADDTHKPECDAALDKADAILATLRTRQPDIASLQRD